MLVACGTQVNRVISWPVPVACASPLCPPLTQPGWIGILDWRSQYDMF